jgi:hypothetical protein
MPQHSEQIVHQNTDKLNPTHCLLEDYMLVSTLQVTSERLLTDQEHTKDWVKLIIEVKVLVFRATVYNFPFLG